MRKRKKKKSVIKEIERERVYAYIISFNSLNTLTDQPNILLAPDASVFLLFRDPVVDVSPPIDSQYS